MNNDKTPSHEQRYLGINENYSPTHKDMSDNLRAYLTIVAYAVALRFIWEVDHKSETAQFVFRAISVLWGAWILWFAWLTVVQSFNLVLGFSIHLVEFVFSDLVHKIRSKTASARHTKVFYMIAVVASTTCMVFLLGTLYIITALLEIARLK